MKRISVDPPASAPISALMGVLVGAPIGAMNKALAVLETLDSIVVERCAEQSCEVCAQEFEVAA